MIDSIAGKSFQPMVTNDAADDFSRDIRDNAGSLGNQNFNTSTQDASFNWQGSDVRPSIGIIRPEGEPPTKNEKLMDMLDRINFSNIGIAGPTPATGGMLPSDNYGVSDAEVALKAGNTIAMLEARLGNGSGDDEAIKETIAKIKGALEDAGINLDEYLVKNDPWVGPTYRLKDGNSEMKPL